MSFNICRGTLGSLAMLAEMAISQIHVIVISGPNFWFLLLSPGWNGQA
jgi:hypothetical protein